MTPERMRLNLVDELMQYLPANGSREMIADFIIKDRERILKPAKDLILDNGGSSYEELCQAIEKMRELAGLMEGE